MSKCGTSIEHLIVENNKLKEENSKEIFVNQEATKYNCEFIVVAKCKKKEKKVKAIQDLVNKYEYCKLKFSHATG